MSCEKFLRLSQNSSVTKKEKNRSSDDEMTKKWIDANTKKCPNCGTEIEKKGGCKKMHCYDCKHVFDWNKL